MNHSDPINDKSMNVCDGVKFMITSIANAVGEHG